MDDIADTLADWQVIKLVSEEDDGYEVGHALIVHSRSGIGYLERRQVLLRLAGLVGECGIEDNCVKVDILTDLTLREALVGVAALLVLLLDALLHLAISLVAGHFVELICVDAFFFWRFLAVL